MKEEMLWIPGGCVGYGYCDTEDHLRVVSAVEWRKLSWEVRLYFFRILA